VPAHNEGELLPLCLAALREAAAAAGIPVRLLVVADACTDVTAAVAAAGGAEVLRIRARNVGVARAAGMAWLLRRTADLGPAVTWLATTDADTVVPPGWLRRQLGYAGQGWDVVLGTVTVTDWTGHPSHTPARFAAMYEFGDGPHPHVHGANLGIRASAYLAAGGFRPLPTAEDHALIAAATEAGCRVLRTGDITVVTSARRQARAPRGFSHALRALAAEPGPGGAAAAGGVLAASPRVGRLMRFAGRRPSPQTVTRDKARGGKREKADQFRRLAIETAIPLCSAPEPVTSAPPAPPAPVIPVEMAYPVDSGNPGVPNPPDKPNPPDYSGDDAPGTRRVTAILPAPAPRAAGHHRGP
jgi:glycosyl transferase family 2